MIWRCFHFFPAHLNINQLSEVSTLRSISRAAPLDVSHSPKISHIAKVRARAKAGAQLSVFSPPAEFSISSFCTVVDVMNYSRLQVLRLDGNEIKRNAVPPDAPLCLRRATIIEI